MIKTSAAGAWKACARLTLALALSATAPVVAGAAIQVNRALAGYIPPANSIGLNVGILGYIYQEAPFVDVFKETQPWSIDTLTVPAGTPITGTTVLGADGWIQSLASNQRARACAFQDLTGRYPGGVYTVLYDGAGVISVSGPVKVVTSTPGRITVQITPVVGGSGPCIVETQTDPANPIRNIRFILPGYESTYLVNPWYGAFLNDFKPFKIIRFMEWSSVNRSDIVNWSDRRPRNYSSQAFSVIGNTTPITYRDVALEYQIDLANRLDVNPWFNIPIMASDDYIYNMAQLVHRTLRTDLHPMIELSNEIWNSRFSQYNYARNMGMALNLDPGATPALSKAGLYWYALRAGQMFDIWNTAYGADSVKITHVIGAQGNWTTEGDAILGYNNTYQKTDLLAIGAYVTPFNFYKITDPAAYAQIAAMTVPQILQTLNVNVTTAGQQWAAHKAVADKYGVGLAAYESGVDFDTTQVPAAYRTAITNLYVKTTRDPGIGTIYGQMLTTQATVGFTAYNHFYDVQRPGPYGGFGLVEYQSQGPTTSVKYTTFLNYILAHP